MTKRATEIERKWLVDDPPKLSRRKGTRIIQGYNAVCSEGVEIRVRGLGDKFFETVKIGLSQKQFKSLWRTTRGNRLEKIRYRMKWQGHKIELDVYTKPRAGLVVAEVEFKSQKQAANFYPHPGLAER